jgi:hypothetical protein
VGIRGHVPRGIRNDFHWKAKTPRCGNTNGEQAHCPGENAGRERSDRSRRRFFVRPPKLRTLHHVQHDLVVEQDPNARLSKMERNSLLYGRRNGQPFVFLGPMGRECSLYSTPSKASRSAVTPLNRLAQPTESSAAMENIPGFTAGDPIRYFFG